MRFGFDNGKKKKKGKVPRSAAIMMSFDDTLRNLCKYSVGKWVEISPSALLFELSNVIITNGYVRSLLSKISLNNIIGTHVMISLSVSVNMHC